MKAYYEEKFDPEGRGHNPDNQYQNIIKIDSLIKAKLRIFDTAGSKKYLLFTTSYLRESNGIILVFINDRLNLIYRIEK